VGEKCPGILPKIPEADFQVTFRDLLHVVLYRKPGEGSSGLKHAALKEIINICLTFRGPCIVIYSYNKSQQDALFLYFILITLHVSDRLTAHHQES
jgi:hypothetical protein